MIDHADQQTLERLAQWLHQTRAEAAENAAEDAEPQPEHFEPHANGQSTGASGAEPPLEIYRLVEEFTALRHEVNLQTRSSRNLEDQTQRLLAALAEALEALRSVEPKEAQAAWSAGKSLAAALADLDEALRRGREQTEKAVARLLDEPRDELLARLDELQAGQSWLGRLLHGRYHRRLRERLANLPPPSEQQSLLAALLDGYRLVQRRLAQAMTAEGVARVDTVGEPVDPEQMVVIDIVETDEVPDGRVVEEVRPGYTWSGRLLKPAEVRAARNPDPWP